MTVALERLLGHGEIYVDPSSVVVWEQADATRPWLPPHLVSIPGLPRDGMVALSRLDFARVAMASLWLKGLMARRVAEEGFAGLPYAESRNALQEVREEAGHALMLLKTAEAAGLCEKALAAELSGLDRLTRGLRPDGLGFWAWMYLGEAVTDAYVLKALRECDELCPVARQVMQLHHREQTRRMAVCKAMVSERLKTAGALRRHLVAMALPRLLRHYLAVMLFPTAESLAALNLPDVAGTVRALRGDQGRRAVGAGCAASAVTVLRRAGVPLRLGASFPW